MDQAFIAGLGIAVVFGLLPYTVKAMPRWIASIGVVLGLILMIYGIVPHFMMKSISTPLALVGAAAVLAMVGRVWHFVGGQSWLLPPAEADIRELSREELVHRNMEMVAKLRELQNTTSIKQREKMLKKEAGAIDLQTQMNAEFLTNLRGPARVLAVETLRREGVYPPFLQLDHRLRGNPILDGNMAGPSPVGDAADFLEDITNNLPQ